MLEKLAGWHTNIAQSIMYLPVTKAKKPLELGIRRVPAANSAKLEGTFSAMTTHSLKLKLTAGL